MALTAIALAAAIRIALWTLPFRWLKQFVEESGTLSICKGKYDSAQVAWAVRLASRYVPQATCLTQALTAQILLSWAGIEAQTRIGVRSKEKFEAHAWVVCNGGVLLGGAMESATYAPMLTLARRASGG